MKLEKRKKVGKTMQLDNAGPSAKSISNLNEVGGLSGIRFARDGGVDSGSNDLVDYEEFKSQPPEIRQYYYDLFPDILVDAGSNGKNWEEAKSEIRSTGVDIDTFPTHLLDSLKNNFWKPAYEKWERENVSKI